jgi:hypothetical protein
MGVPLVSGAAVLANVAIFAIAYGYRIFVEEKVIICELGNSYVE